MPLDVKIMVTGASGFIGNHLCHYFSALGFQIIACTNKEDDAISARYQTLVCQLPNKQFHQLIEKEQPDYLLHCAGSSSVAKSFQTASEDFNNNVVVTDFILNCLKDSSPLTKVVFFSSAAVYGEVEKLPINTKTAMNPISPYGFHKLLCEINCQKYNQLFGIPITIIRIFSVYGPGLKKQVIWDIIQKAFKSSKVSLFGTGAETRDFVYISDLLDIVASIMKKSAFNANIYNIATGNATSIKKIAEAMLKLMGCASHELLFTGEKKFGDPLNWQIDENNLYRTPAEWISLEVGLQHYLAWIKEENNLQ